MPSPDTEPELDLRAYLRVLLRRRRIIALAVLAAVGASLVASFLQPSTYQSSAQLVLQDNSTDPFTSTTIQVDPQRVVLNETQLITSPQVKDGVRRLIGAAPTVTVAAVGQSNTISITASAPKPEQAADIANAYATAYLTAKRNQAVDSITKASDQIQLKINDLLVQIANQPSPTLRNGLINQATVFQQTLTQLQVRSKLQTAGAQVSSPATVPSAPSSPKPARSAILALAIGLILGVGAALLLEYLDDSIKSKDDLDTALAGLPTLGIIPAVATWKVHEEPIVVTLSAPSSPASEAYRSLRTSVQFLNLGRSTTVLEVTSPNPGEGKSTTTINLAVSMAQAGQQVCVVDCDLRKPRLHQFVGLSNKIGFTSALTGECSLSQALQPVPDLAGLSLLASGELPPNPAELLASERTGELFSALRARFDAVLVDSPPALPVTDAAILAPHADATLLVVTAGTTNRRSVSRAVEVLAQVDAPLVGGVLNASRRGDDYRYGYGAGYGTGYGTYQGEPARI